MKKMNKIKALLIILGLIGLMTLCSCSEDEYINLNNNIEVISIGKQHIRGEPKFVYTFKNLGVLDNWEARREKNIYFYAVSSSKEFETGQVLTGVEMLKQLHNSEILRGDVNQNSDNQNTNQNNINIIVGQEPVRSTNDLLSVYNSITNRHLAIGDTIFVYRN